VTLCSKKEKSRTQKKKICVKDELEKQQRERDKGSGQEM
jgi:hypothetical protein